MYYIYIYSLSESVKQGKSMTKKFFFFFQIMLNEVLKMISADVKADVKQQIKDLAVASQNFYEKYLQKLKYTVKRANIFHLILVGIPSSLILLVKNRRWGGGGGGAYLTKCGESYLSMVP